MARTNAENNERIGLFVTLAACFRALDAQGKPSETRLREWALEKYHNLPYSTASEISNSMHNQALCAELAE